jgi:Fe-S-cluster containining protein
MDNTDGRDGRKDLDDGLRFLHVMGMQTKLDVADASARVLALTEELVARGLISLRGLEDRVDRVRTTEAERTANQSMVQVAPAVDKYSITEVPQIDCVGLIPICKGRCCRLSFPLSFQDLDEQKLKFDYAMPYLIIKQGEDGFCVHSSPESRGCTVYDLRPTICRTYDCRKDARIWKDFDKKVPADDDAIPLVRIRKRPLVPSPAT